MPHSVSQSACNDLPAALANAEAALTLNHCDGDALRLKGACQLGLALRGIATLRQSMQLRPGDPLNWRAPNTLCWYYYLAGDYPAAARAGLAATMANTRQCVTHGWLAASLGQMRRIEKAGRVIARASQLIAAISFDEHVQRRIPWMSDDGQR